jgi:hypothetical protein
MDVYMEKSLNAETGPNYNIWVGALEKKNLSFQ